MTCLQAQCHIDQYALHWISSGKRPVTWRSFLGYSARTNIGSDGLPSVEAKP